MDLRDISTFVGTLHGDVNRCVTQLNENADHDFWARTYVRAVGSLIEGSVVLYKEAIATLWKEGHVTLTTEQQLFFLNLDWRVTKNGAIETMEKKLPSKDGLKAFLVQLGQVVMGKQLDLGGPGWAGLSLFYDTRDALLHPKNVKGVLIEANTIHAIDLGRAWLTGVFKEINVTLLERIPANG